MKQIFTILVALLATTNLWAYDFQYGELYYKITSDTTVEVTYQEYSTSNYSGLTSVTIPETVTYEGTTYSVTSIGVRAFYDCRSLTSITISNSVTSIGNSAFEGCHSLTSIAIPNSVTSIGERAFSNCSSLSSIVVESGNSTYDSRENCNAIIETATNTLIAGCQNTIIPNSVTSIGYGAFNGCRSLTSVTIPNNVTSIGYGVFWDCSALTSMVVESGNSTYDSRENCNAIIETATNTLIAGCQNTIIPNSVTSIGEYAFCYCSSLTSVTIPNSVTSIGHDAFRGCSSLPVENNLRYADTYLVEAVDETLSTYSIKEGTKWIGYYAFGGCSALTSITIPNSVTSIGNEVFNGCHSLTSVTIGNSVTSIGDGAFFLCSNLKTVICEAIEVPELGGYVFYNMPLSEATLYVPAQSLDDYKAAEQWKEFGTILPIEGESEEEIELQDTEMTIVFTNSEDNDSEIYRQTLTIKVPIAPTIAGFTFLYWQPVAEPITNEITIQAIYEADGPSSAPEVYVNPANPAQKLLRNGQVYILQDGKTYTITGQEL